MSPERQSFYNSDIFRLEQILLEHPVATLFTGNVYLNDDTPLEEFDLHGIVIGPVDAARLFWLPDESIFLVRTAPAQPDGTPAEIRVESDNAFVQENEANVVCAYAEVSGEYVRINDMYLDRIMLDGSAAERFATVAFGLMAVTAYKYDFKKITLYAAGRAPVTPEATDEMVGFAVWPKFGFDADVDPAELGNAEHLKGCRTVSAILERDAAWWEQTGGSGREMEFNLSPGSKSWTILLDYICTTLL